MGSSLVQEYDILYLDVPIMGSINGGTYFNVLYLNFDKKTKKIVRSSIEGPIPVCEKIFNKTLDCSYKTDYSLEKLGDLEAWAFHNHTVSAHE